MLKTAIVLSVSTLALAMTAPAMAGSNEEASNQSAADTARADRPTMNFGTWGFDTAELDQAVEPGDDFFAYANGKWVERNTIPADKARFGAFDLLGEKSRTDVQTLINDLVAANPAPGTQERRVVDAYNAYFDTAAIDAAGMAPAAPYLARINDAQSLADLAMLFETPGFPALVSAGVTVDEKAPDAYIPTIGFNGMGLPDRDYYLVDNERNAAIRTAYLDYLTFMLDKAGYSEPAQMAEQVYAFEHKVAELEWDRVALRNSELTYNKVSREDLGRYADGFPIDRVLATVGLNEQPYFSIAQIPPDAAEQQALGLDSDAMAGIGGGLPAMMGLLQQTPLPVLKAFMAKSFLRSFASVLPSAIDDRNFAFYGTTLSGAEEQEPRWKRAISATQGQLGEVLGELYVQRYFPPESKAAMDDLVANLRKALAQSLNENDFMGDDTRRQAQAKLASFNPKIGYPDTFESYEGLTIAPNDPLGNLVRTIAWNQQDQLSKLGEPVDKTEWFMLPMTVNAYYNPVFNEIVFPAAILQRPFFSADNDPAVNYGAIGAVIGHEMGHGFDDQGAKYSATGALENWWDETDLARFDKLTGQLAAQYDAYCPYDEGDTCVNGKFTLGENIGDVGGLSMAYRAYRMSLDGKEAPVLDGLTGDQRFFLAWAQVWRSMQREAMGRQRLQTDPHSPETFRVNGAVRNLDAWYRAFDVKPDDTLYLPPEDRVRIW